MGIVKERKRGICVMKENSTKKTHQENLAEAQETIDRLKEKVMAHHWYLNYHVSPPAQWMNDPNGFSFYQGEYHLFYQHHPFSTEWGPMYWGHVKSKDLVRWEHLPIALAPSEDFDRDGCFSGSAIEKDGKLYLMYTGNIFYGPNQDEELIQKQALAVSTDGIHFEKHTANPVIAKTPAGDIHPAHFRDPKVWQHDDGMYYCVLGSKTKTNTGQVLLYRSKDLIDWQFVSVMAKGEGNFGYMWECPDVFHLDGKDVLILSPQGMKPEGDHYHNLHQAGYVIGNLDYATGKLSHGEFHLLDYGFDFYAPQTMLDDKGRRIIIAWMSMWEDQMPTQAAGWAGAMTLPRIVELQGDRLITKPVPELEALRQNEVSYAGVKITNEHLTLKGIEGDCFELEMEADIEKASQFVLKLRVDTETGEETMLRFDTATEKLTLDRTNSGEGEKGIRNVKVSTSNKKLTLQLFMDKSSVEVFINGGEQVMTARLYPNENATGIQFFAEGEVELTRVRKWELQRSIK